LRLVVTGARRFSQAISEGDGISLVAAIADLDTARAAEEHGAEALVLRTAVDGLAGTTGLPLLWRPPGSPEEARAAGADACVVAVSGTDDDGDELERLHRDALDLGLDCVIEVHDEEELELALERIDPEIFLLSVPRADDGEPPLEPTLDLLPDVPAGKLAVAEVEITHRDEVAELERAGVDAVIVRAGSVAELIGEPPPEV
jgi:indole-3-glycerol phosphate synthase